MTFEPRNLAEAMAVRLVARADQFYVAGDWGSALPIYRHLIDSQPALAQEFGLAVSAGHCAIELADPAALDGWSMPPAPAHAVPRATAFAQDIRVRAIHYCRDRDFVRATTLLRHIAPVDGPTGFAYADGMLTRRTDYPASFHKPPDAPPRFITDYAIDALPIDALKQRHAGKRLLLVRRYGDTQSRHGAGDNLRRTAIAFGLQVHEAASVVQPGAASEQYVGTMRQIVESFRPDVIFWDELFLSGISGDAAYADAIAELLADVRRRLGIKVIKFYTDPWYVTAHMPDQLFGRLGQCYDLINHHHPDILGLGTPAERDAVFCCHPPQQIETPTATAGSIPRAVFVGSLHPGGMPRVVWWAECGRAGLALDFIETIHDRAVQLTDLEYVNLLRSYQISVNLTLRATGARMLTGRALETMLSGGVLLEERSRDTDYFYTPGVHYAGFETLPDLAATIPELLADAPRRQRMAAAGQAWTQRYYTGDVYWAGMLSKLFP